MTFTECVEDALFRLNNYIDHCHVFAWPQEWTNTSCGFGGMCGQAFTTKQAIVVISPENKACVYHAGKFAYTVEDVDEDFMSRIDKRKIPGKDEFEKMKEVVHACV